MISSMTGFGSAKLDDEAKSIYVEVRSVNGRFLKTKIKCPEFLKGYEEEIEKLLKQKISRGSVTLAINCNTTNNMPLCEINIDNLKAYHAMMLNAKKAIDHNGEVSFDSLINLPGVVERVTEDKTELEKELIDAVFKLINTSVDTMMEMRLRSGADIKNEIMDRGEKIKSLVKEVESLVPQMVENYTDRLHVRVSNMLKNSEVQINKDDLAREIAVFADRSDITEEIKLLSSHVDHFGETMNAGGHVGKKLEFVVQEMFREANTMGSKSNDDGMLNRIFDIKNEIEKIKELTLNIE